MKKIFLDCGGNIGQSVTMFKSSDLYSPDYVIYSFEPVPNLNKNYKERKDIIFSDKAVWIDDGFVNFYIGKRHNGVGSTLKKNKWSCSPDFNNPITVESIDFSKWIKNNFSKDDYIILKMDIEGAEYDVLPKMIKDGTINYINKAFVEFHYERMHMEKEIHDNLIKELKNINGFELLEQLRGYINAKNKTISVL